MTVAFLTWYLAYVLLSTYAPDFMATEVFGNVNLGILLGLAQFVTTFVITHLYVAHANRNTDPIADEMRDRLERRGIGRAVGAGQTLDTGARVDVAERFGSVVAGKLEEQAVETNVDGEDVELP